MRGWIRVAAILLGVVPRHASGQAAACPAHAPVAQLGGVSWYADREHFSIVDPERRRQHDAMLKPLTDLMLDLGRIADGAAGAPGPACALGLLRGWAAAGALLQTPANFNGVVERAVHARGLNIVAFKLNARGTPPEAATLAWLRRLSLATTADFARRGRVDNLYAWSAVNAASFLILAPDAQLAQHEQRAWERSLSAIREDGLIATEAERGQRTLVYHQYFLAALIMTQRFREARGLPTTPAERAKLALLARRVGEGFCDPRRFAAAAGNIAQEIPAQPNQRIPTAMGGSLLTEEYRRCAPVPTHFNQPQLGGRLDLTQSLLARTAPAR
ncbi:alginate lyase family protein [Sediminicoccus sp. KRV36]|uniref:alginate lyase family protein n=1 Tax=Sediminicoccus sp. KRV36 TaxID=3133721 RepID=UPI002010B76A|nr:alginate lyase family protein [Sediminicoccus rosea]UPY37478.1 alginate lyase family protein [Sediminicoccus rosea]